MVATTRHGGELAAGEIPPKRLIRLGTDDTRPDTPNPDDAADQAPTERQPQSPLPRIDRAAPLDRDTARALVDAGLMPLCQYIRMFGTDPDEPSCDAAADRQLLTKLFLAT